MIRNPENQFAVSGILNSGSFPWTQTPESLKYGGKGNMHFFPLLLFPITPLCYEQAKVVILI